MKKDIHPEYRMTTVRCHCGHEFEAGSTKKNISIEICSQCHPFYTGKQKLVDSAGRIERFRRKYGDYLGDITYYSRWKQYIFEPLVSGVVFSWECLSDVTNKLKECNKQKKLVE